MVWVEFFSKESKVADTQLQAIAYRQWAFWMLQVGKGGIYLDFCASWMEYLSYLYHRYMAKCRFLNIPYMEQYVLNMCWTCRGFSVWVEDTYLFSASRPDGIHSGGTRASFHHIFPTHVFFGGFLLHQPLLEFFIGNLFSAICSIYIPNPKNDREGFSMWDIWDTP